MSAMERVFDLPVLMSRQCTVSGNQGMAMPPVVLVSALFRFLGSER